MRVRAHSTGRAATRGAVVKKQIIPKRGSNNLLMWRPRPATEKQFALHVCHNVCGAKVKASRVAGRRVLELKLRYRMSVSVDDWGTADGLPVRLWTLQGAAGMRMRVTNYGTIITQLHVPGRDGTLVDVVLGRQTLQDYVEQTQYFGCTVGRCANRICGGEFSIDGSAFEATRNNGANCLHGGAKGFDKMVWDAEASVEDGAPKIVFRYTSKHGEEGFPGSVAATVSYTLTPHNVLRVEMSATTDAPTIVNLAHHSYWNLSGHSSGTVLDHQLQVMASCYTPVDARLIPTGDILPVAGTPFDFRLPKTIGRDISQLPATEDDPGGFDHNWCVDGAAGDMRPAALLHSDVTGICMRVSSNQAGIQCYSGNFLDGVPGKEGAIYRKQHSVCLETQAYPDSVNKRGRGWPDVVLRPGQRYLHCMEHAFTTVA